ncbi:MAG TPA: NAD(+)/NADH kinase [Candidatus Dormibacteraeota bacterium]|nr:NAD(+)/NADH kinase [Candidatus Dormibacteraeota bacterium]
MIGAGAVGLIVNPAAGRDIRRLVGAASVMPHHEKAAIVRRVLRGLEAAGIDRVRYLPDGAGIVDAAADVPGLRLRLESLPVRPQGSARDSIEAARLLATEGAGAIVTLGGDGTNRAVATSCGRVPLVAISTGTNNVVPSMVEGTIAGLAAGLVACGAVAADEVAPAAKWVEVSTGGVRDVALVDVAACRDAFRGAAAIWDPARVRAVVLSRAEPWAVGLSSIGGRLRPLGPDEPVGLYVELGDVAAGDPTVRAVLAPGLTADVPVRECRLLGLGEEVALPGEAGIVALDGEREIPCRGRVTARVTAGGPRLVDVRRVLTIAGRAPVT